MYELDELDNTHAVGMSSLLAGSQLDGLKSTQGVDGPVSWRLTLDQDLIDTLKGSFPNWFQNSPDTTSSSSPSIGTLPNDTILTDSDICNGLITVQVATDKLYQENLLHESFDEMAEGDRLGNPSASTGPSLLGTDGSNTTMTNCYDSRQSPPKAIVDSSPLQPAMDKNKESLKVKLMVRRPITQLVEQGIIPPLKTSPAIHEQCKQLERAKTGDLLKAKIQQRPDRQELERRHILEHDESHVDPSLAEKQRMLKKARLADQLNSQISHRPGPLELIKKNILHTEQPIERIVKEGLVSFKATSEGLLNRPQQPNSYITFEDDSQSSESDTRTSPARSDVIEAAATSAGIVTVALTIPTSGGTILQTKFHPTLIPTTATAVTCVPPPPPLPNSISSIKSSDQIQVKQDTSNLFAELCQSVAGPSPSPSFLPLAASPASLGSSTSTLSPLSSVASPPQSTTPRPAQSPLQHIHQSQKSDAPGKDKNRKKSKSKPVSKARTIKFHEYKGPPNAQKNSSLEPCTKESSYQLMLEQQNCLLRFLENLHKNRTILQAPSKSVSNSAENSVQSQPSSTTPMPSPALSVASSIPSSPAPSHADSVTTTTSTTVASDVTKLEKMKVSDLKAHLKKRNLPVSGPKPQLIERLKPYLPLESLDTYTGPEMMSSETCDGEVINSPRHSLSPESEHEHMDIQQVDSPTPSVISINNDDIVREQQRRIDELQRQLEQSKQELMQIKQNQQVMVVEQPPPPPPPINQKMVVKQQLEAKIQKQQAKQQAQLALRNKTPALIKPKEEVKPQPPPQTQPQQIQIQTHQGVPPQSINQIPIVWNGDTATVLLLGVQDNKKLVGGHHRTASLPSILLPIPTTNTTGQTIQTIDQLIETKPIINQVIATHEAIPQLQPTPEIKPPPPLYEEATKQLNAANVLKREIPVKKHVKSDNLTDILNILVKNGDISPSALDPTTPSTPGSVIMTQEILFDNSGTGTHLVQTQPHLDSQQQQQPQLQQVQLQSQPQPQRIHLQIQPQPQPQVHIQKLPDPVQKSEVNVFDTSLFLNTPQTSSIQSMDMASPLQPNCHIDNENVASALDTFLQEHSEEPPANGDIAPYDDFDLLELMSQQLDMDISDETSCQTYTAMDTTSAAGNTPSYQKSGMSSKRGMNPCLQPSINELIQQQEQQNSSNNNGNSSTNSSNNNGPSLTCNGLLNGFDPSSFDMGNSNNNFTSTPMDVCDDFETHLNNFSFSSLSPDSNINTPPHPFSTALSSSTCSTSGPHNPLDFNHSSNSNGQVLNGTSDADAFGGVGVNQDNLPELFNIDDYKMGWSVDFAV